MEGTEVPSSANSSAMTVGCSDRGGDTCGLWNGPSSAPSLLGNSGNGEDSSSVSSILIWSRPPNLASSTQRSFLAAVAATAAAALRLLPAAAASVCWGGLRTIFETLTPQVIRSVSITPRTGAKSAAVRYMAPVYR